MASKEKANLARLKSSAVLGSLGTLKVMDVMLFFSTHLVKPPATEGIKIIMPL